jgi:S-DNA-T family DNA segregation ATPase FtsK/SpoIIIE
VTRTTASGKVVQIKPEIKGGQAVGFDLRKAPHVLVSGTTGSGKSVALHGVICDLIHARTPQICSLVLIDPKQVEFGAYEGLPHVIGPNGAHQVHRTSQEAAQALAWVLRQVEERLAVMRLAGVKDVALVPDLLWALWQADPGTSKQGRYVVVVVDELADLVLSSRYGAGLPGSTSPEQSLARILALGRAAGVHCVLATQRPSVDVVTGVIKANVPSRLAFALQNATDSRVALGVRGAEELRGAGDALWLPLGQREPVRLQGRMVGEVSLAR